MSAALALVGAPTAALIGLAPMAAWDVKRQEVADWATGLLGAVVVAALISQGIAPMQWAYGIFAAAFCFLAYLWLGQLGVVGGGDVKLAPVLGLSLGAFSLLLGVWWVFLALLLQIGLHLFQRRVLRLGGPTPHLPAMALGFMVAAALV